MLADPVACDIHATGYPDVAVALDMIKQALQGEEAARTADQAAVQADRHHARRFCAFGIKNVEGVTQVVEEILAIGEALG